MGRIHVSARILFVVTCATSFFAVRFATATPRTWDANGANPANGTFNVAANWNPDGVPVAGDTQAFGLAGTYTVSLSADAASDSASFTAGTVTIRSDSATVRNYTLSTGASSLVVLGT